VEVLDHRHAGGDEGAARDHGADDPPEEHAVLVLVRTRK
jgi:hypothetical protein